MYSKRSNKRDIYQTTEKLVFLYIKIIENPASSSPSGFLIHVYEHMLHNIINIINIYRIAIRIFRPASSNIILKHRVSIKYFLRYEIVSNLKSCIEVYSIVEPLFPRNLAGKPWNENGCICIFDVYMCIG